MGEEERERERGVGVCSIMSSFVSEHRIIQIVLAKRDASVASARVLRRRRARLSCRSCALKPHLGLKNTPQQRATHCSSLSLCMKSFSIKYCYFGALLKSH